MSGICGIIYFEGKSIQNELVDMVDALAHRGSDGISHYQQAHVGLAHLMQHVTYESVHESQPLVGKSGCVCVADARIDNRVELIERLGLKPANGVVTDAELIMEAYECWGDECPEHLIGDFAFVVWNPQRQQLLVVRDHMGVRPLFYYHKPGHCFAFASEISALLSLSFVPKQLHEAKMAIYLCWFSDFRMYSKETYYNDILALEPAYRITITKDNFEKRFFWEFLPEKFAHLKTENDFLEAFKETFIEAVRCRVRTPFSVSSHLSGGFDSSSVSVIARNILRERDAYLHTVYIDVKHPNADEKFYAQSVVNTGGIKHEWVSASKGFYESSNVMMEICHTPDHSVVPALNQLPVAQAIAQNRSRVALTGHDGDSIVGHGSGWIVETLRQRRWKVFRKSVYSIVDIFDKKGAKKEYFYRKYLKEYVNGLMKEYLIQKKWLALIRLLVGASVHVKYRVSGADIYKGVIKLLFKDDSTTKIPPHSFLNKERAERMHKSSVFVELFHWPEEMPQPIRNIYAANIIEQNEVFNNVSARHGFVYVHPFLDKRLIELCAVIPREINFDNGVLRGVIRKSMAEYLPLEVAARKTKVDFSGYQLNLLESLENTTFNSKIDPIVDWIDMNRYTQFFEKNERRETKNEELGVLRAIYLNWWLKN